MFAVDAEVQPDGKVTIPQEVMEALGMKEGNEVAFIASESGVRMMNASCSAAQQLLNEKTLRNAGAPKR